MILYKGVNQSDLGAVQFLANGDGTSLELKLKLNAAPFNLNFQGNPPNLIFAATNGDSSIPGDSDIATTASIAQVGQDTIMTITWGSALLMNLQQPYSIRCEFLYAGI